jgi:hypothetical protein
MGEAGEHGKKEEGSPVRQKVDAQKGTIWELGRGRILRMETSSLRFQPGVWLAEGKLMTIRLQRSRNPEARVLDGSPTRCQNLPEKGKETG